tara:strand:+ start:337 stop:963 length:627 start_codon:yes stop_codon:yes gene_type:complete
MRFLLVDDHSIVRFGLKLLLQESFPISVLEEATNYTTSIKKLKENEYDLIILDITLPNTDTFQLIDRIFDFNPNNKILLFSMVSEYTIIKRFIKKGVRGFVSKNVEDDEILKAVKTTLDGKRYIDSDIMDAMINDNNFNFEGHPFRLLSERELQITTHLLEGQSITSIASLLNIQPSTVGTHKAKIMSKLGVSNIIQLVELSKSYSSD